MYKPIYCTDTLKTQSLGCPLQYSLTEVLGVDDSVTKMLENDNIGNFYFECYLFSAFCDFFWL